MGNRLNDVKPLRKNQARQALLSGEAGKGGVFAMQEAVTVIRIPLIQINHLLLFDITKGDSVKIRWKDGSFFCFFKASLLGRIPGNYNKRLNQAKSYNATIYSVKSNPPEVIVEVNF